MSGTVWLLRVARVREKGGPGGGHISVLFAEPPGLGLGSLQASDLLRGSVLRRIGSVHTMDTVT